MKRNPRQLRTNAFWRKSKKLAPRVHGFWRKLSKTARRHITRQLLFRPCQSFWKVKMVPVMMVAKKMKTKTETMMTRGVRISMVRQIMYNNNSSILPVHFLCRLCHFQLGELAFTSKFGTYRYICISFLVRTNINISPYLVTI